mmetsp:Transcript_30735/g.64983  ORF Transcript_30735/g.64983 Transcript_30735/m.64983 type:complete len:201 (-) Transcript_30735:1788-2390(-)
MGGGRELGRLFGHFERGDSVVRRRRKRQGKRGRYQFYETVRREGIGDHRRGQESRTLCGQGRTHDSRTGVGNDIVRHDRGRRRRRRHGFRIRLLHAHQRAEGGRSVLPPLVDDCGFHDGRSTFGYHRRRRGGRDGGEGRGQCGRRALRFHPIGERGRFGRGGVRRRRRQPQREEEEEKEEEAVEKGSRRRGVEARRKRRL